MRQAVLAALVALTVVEVRSCAAPARADRSELAVIADELRQIRRILERRK